MVKVSAFRPKDRGFEPHQGHDHVSAYDTSTGCFQEADSKVIQISCKLSSDRAKTNNVKTKARHVCSQNYVFLVQK